MRVFFLIAAASLIVTPVSAQMWTAEQQEVWDFEQACWASRQLEVSVACFHDDFQGWGLDDTVPTSKADRRVTFARGFETQEQVFLHLRPVSINVHGNMATALYLSTYTNRNLATGEETTATERWTDILVREGGRWSWVADHGVMVSGN